MGPPVFRNMNIWWKGGGGTKYWKGCQVPSLLLKSSLTVFFIIFISSYSLKQLMWLTSWARMFKKDLKLSY